MRSRPILRLITRYRIPLVAQPWHIGRVKVPAISFYPSFWEYLINVFEALTSSGSVILGLFIAITLGLGQISGIEKSGNAIAHSAWTPAVVSKAQFDGKGQNLDILIPQLLLNPLSS